MDNGKFFDLKVKASKARRNNYGTMKKTKIIEVAVKMLVAALTAFLTAITTTSCMGRGPLDFLAA